MRLVIRLIAAVLFVASGASSQAFAAETLASGKIDNSPDPYWPDSQSSGSGSAGVILDLDQSMLAGKIAYLNLLGTVASIKLSVTGSNPPQAITQSLPVTNSPDTNSAQMSISLGDANFWDASFKGAMTTQQAQDSLNNLLTAGLVYLSVNTYRADAEVRGLLWAQASPLLVRRARRTTPLHELTVGRQSFECGADLDLPRCIIPVYVWIDYGGSCWSFVPFDEVMVKQHTTPRVIWHLFNSQPADGSKYRFTASKGIFLQNNGHGQNDQRKDFGPPNGDNQDDRRFRWNSIHSQPGTFGYSVVVERLDPDSGVPQACLPADPTVTNE
jgi:hypothetical protein